MPEITVFYGLYGSGKSEISINYTIELIEKGHCVTLVDLDAVTPYFRVRDVKDILTRKGVEILAPKEPVHHGDLPVLPEGIRRIFAKGSRWVVIDVGGDPTGARVLGGLRDSFSDETKGLFVLNFNRPFSQTLEEAKRSIEEIAGSSGLWPCGLVSNTHLGPLTRVSHIVEGFRLAQDLGKSLNLPVCFCGAPFWLKDSQNKIKSSIGDTPILWIKRFLSPPWEMVQGGNRNWRKR